MLLKPAFPVLNREHPLADGLVGAWLFAEGSGDHVADLAGNRPATWHNQYLWRPSNSGMSMRLAPWDSVSSRAYGVAEQPPVFDHLDSQDFSILIRFSGRIAGSGTYKRLLATRADSNNFVQVSGANNINSDKVQFIVVLGGVFHRLITDGPIYTSDNLGVGGADNIVVCTWRSATRTPSLWLNGWQETTEGIGSSWNAGSQRGLYFGQRSDLRPETAWVAGNFSQVCIWDRVISVDEISHLQHDSYAAFRDPPPRFTWLFVSPPENLTAPTLHINPDGTWTGGLGTWTNNPTNYAWELRRAADDSMVDSGSTSDAGTVLVGSLFISGDYYLWVYAENSGGSLSAVSSTAVMQVGSQITFDAFRTSRRIMGEVRMGRRILGEVRIG